MDSIIDSKDSILDIILMSGGQWQIDIPLATKYLSQFSIDVDMLRSGASTEDVFAPRLNASMNVDTYSVGDSSVAVFNLSGVMRMDNGLCSIGVQSLANLIRKASSDPSISAIVIAADTPGGEATAGAELGNAVKESSKPIYFYAHTLASAGYKSALGADGIFAADAQSIFGSIGVMATFNKSILQKIKDNTLSVYSAKSPNKNKEFNSLLNGDIEQIKQHLTKVDSVFMEDVMSSRNLTGDSDYKNETLSGDVFLANEAIDRGLIDGIATLSEVINMAASNKGRKKNIKNKDNNMQNVFSNIMAKLGMTESTTDADSVKAMGDRIDELMANSKLEVEALNASIASIQSELSVIKEANIELSTKLTTLQSEYDLLQVKVSESEATIESLKTENAILKEKNQELSALSGAKILNENSPKFKQQDAVDISAIEKKFSKSFEITIN